MLCSFHRVFIVFICFLSFATALAQEPRVVVVPLVGENIDQCRAITACEAGQQTLSCPSGNEQISCAIPKRVFITSTSHTGDLGGLTGADAICQDLANTQGMFTEFKAWLSTDTESPNTRLVQSVAPYVLLNDEIVAADFADLTDGNIVNPINIDELGQEVRDSVWTGTKSNGDSFNCVNWSYEAGLDFGTYGASFVTGAGWTDRGFGECDESARLYCFEQ